MTGGATPIRDVLLPHSDRVALAQALAVAVVTAVAAVAVRRERSLVLLVVGAGLTLLGVMGLRTLH